MRARFVSVVVLCLFAVAGDLRAQLARPKADVTPLVESDAVHAGSDVRVALTVTLPAGFHVQSNQPRDANFIPTVLTVDPPAGVAIAEIVYPPAMDLKQEGQDQPLAVFDRTFAIGVRLTVASGVAAGDVAVPAGLRYQACNDKVCFIPTTAETSWTLHVVLPTTPVHTAHADVFRGIAFGRGDRPTDRGAANPAVPGRPDVPNARSANFDGFVVLDSTGGYLRTGDFLTFIRNAETGVKRRGMFEGRGPLAILLLVFLGGLALNLTPCVLPMIPINLAIIGAGSQTQFGDGFPSRGRGFGLGATYGAAMALVYGVLGLIVILTAGTFGTINSSPWFNAGIAILFVVLALAMFDVVTIDFSKYSARLTPGARTGSFALAFGMGAVAALLAGACVAPVVIEVVLFASSLYAKGDVLALGLPFCLGLGMAVPWPIAGAGIASLPRPGAWMVRVKQVFGVLILATAAYYGYEAYTIFANRWVEQGAVRSSVEEKIKEGWYASLADGLDAARRESKPALIDMWATWCKNCLTMDKTTLRDPDVVAALAGYVKIKFQAENPDEPSVKAVMQRFNAVGLPTYVILKTGSAGSTGKAGT